jgi:hypothetical protein
MEALIHLFRNWGMTTWLLSLPMCGPVWTGPACCLHCPATCRWQAWGQSLLIVTILIYLVAKLLLGVPPPTPVHILLLSDKSTEWTEHFRKGGSAAMVIGMTMRVLVEELLCQDSRGWSLVFENLPTKSVWHCGYVLSCSSPNIVAP